MASCSSCCIPSLGLSRTWPRKIQLSDGSRSRSETDVMFSTTEKKLKLQLDYSKTSNGTRSTGIATMASGFSKGWPQKIEQSDKLTSRSKTHIVFSANEKKSRRGLDQWKTFNGARRGIGIAMKEKKLGLETKLGAQVDEWKTSGSSDRLNASLIRDDLLGLIHGEERGLRTQQNGVGIGVKRDEIMKAIDALAVLGAETVTTDESLSEPWRLLWTTEKETLFIVEKAPLFGTEAGDIFQIIDVAGLTLSNVITFPPTGLFVVNSRIDIESAQRVNFKFTAAALRVGGWKIPFPPFGQGWFENVYLDDKIRVSKDIRGDYLVCDRAPNVPDLLW